MLQVYSLHVASYTNIKVQRTTKKGNQWLLWSWAMSFAIAHVSHFAMLQHNSIDDD